MHSNTLTHTHTHRQTLTVHSHTPHRRLLSKTSPVRKSRESRESRSCGALARWRTSFHSRLESLTWLTRRKLSHVCTQYITRRVRHSFWPNVGAGSGAGSQVPCRTSAPRSEKRQPAARHSCNFMRITQCQQTRRRSSRAHTHTHSWECADRVSSTIWGAIDARLCVCFGVCSITVSLFRYSGVGRRWCCFSAAGAVCDGLAMLTEWHAHATACTCPLSCVPLTMRVCVCAFVVPRCDEHRTAPERP